MQTVQSFMARRSGADPGGADPGAATSLQTLPAAPDGAGLRQARAGTSAVSAFSNFAMSFRTAAAYDAQARGEELASRVEYTQAQEKANAIGRAYADTIAAQGVQAAANGVDLASGSVQAAGRDAETDADRQLGLIRRSAQMNAQLRLARAQQFRAASSATKATGFLSLFGDIGDMALKAVSGGAA